jgi:hypothetical protein
VEASWAVKWRNFFSTSKMTMAVLRHSVLAALLCFLISALLCGAGKSVHHVLIVGSPARPICCCLTRLFFGKIASEDEDAITCGSAIKIQQGETNYYLNSEEKQLGNGVRG